MHIVDGCSGCIVHSAGDSLSGLSQHMEIPKTCLQRAERGCEGGGGKQRSRKDASAGK